MSRIERVETHRLSVPLHTPFVTALRRTTAVESLVVAIIDADGVTGWGEAPQVWKVTGESTVGAEACVLGPLQAVLAGADVEDLAPLTTSVAGAVVGNFGAKAAVDVALHDLVARRRGLSLPVFLGGKAHRVPTDVTLAAEDTEAVARAAADRTADGFSVLKLKVGADAATDVARVMAARDAAGPTARIRLDANQGWTAREAVHVVSSLEDAAADLELVEQPVAAADLDGLAWVTSRVGTPVMADESVFGVRDLMEVIRRRAADMVNIKLAKCGGLTNARTLLALATAHGMGTIVGSMMETEIGVGAAASLVAAQGTSATSDLDAAWWVACPAVIGGLRYDGATVVLPQTPGLGIAGLASGG